MDSGFNVTMTSSLRQAVLTVAPPSDVRTEQGCLILEPKSAATTDTFQGVASQQTKFWISVITSAGFVPLLFVVGLPGNVLSAAVFYRQGLRERINLCIFCLALADVVVLTVTFCLSFEEVHRFYIGPHNFFIVHFVGLTGFIRVSMFLSAVIAAERCFCVVSPLLAQRVLSTRTLAVIIACVSLVLVAGMQVIAGHRRTEMCVYDPLTNTTSTVLTFTEFYKENKQILDFCSQIVYGTVIPVIFFVFVLVTTIITAIKLQSAHRWRQQSTSAATSAGTGSLEKNMVAMTRMLVVTSVVFVATSSTCLWVPLYCLWVPLYCLGVPLYFLWVPLYCLGVPLYCLGVALYCLGVPLYC
ncbi:hypothetical protein ACOMHN_049034 [Nucella lapillus]